VDKLYLSTDRQGRITTLQRWFRWLEDRGAIEGHPMLAVQAAFLFWTTGPPAEAERWADVVDRWQNQDAARPDDPPAEATAAALRASLCRRGVEQMRADADEAVRRLAEVNFVAPVAPLMQGVARVLCGDLDGGDACLEDAASIGEEVGAHEILATTLCERSLVAIVRGDWGRAEGLAGQARAVLRRAGLEDSWAMLLVCVVQARSALHRGDAPAARQELVSAQRVRPLLTYALPYFAVQARIELTRVHFALGDLAGARTLMREIDDVLKRRPGLGTLVGEAGALRAQLAKVRGSSVPGASALTAAELRLLPLLSTHLSFAEIGAELFLSPNTAKTHAVSIYRKLHAGTRGQAVSRARELGLLEG
jgi:LuxR family maltose regulon positive regulatory protein